MKHLETEQADRINEVFDKNIDPEEKPIFFGKRDAKLITDVISNGEEVNAIVASKLSRTIEKILSKANKQFCDYRTRHPRKNSVNICVVLNSTLQEYTPELVGFAIHGKMKTSQHMQPRFSQIDAVIYISEKHFQVLSDERTAMAMLIYEGIGFCITHGKVCLFNVCLIVGLACELVNPLCSEVLHKVSKRLKIFPTP